MNAKKASILTHNINKIIEHFKLNSEFWNELAKSNIFPSIYIDHMKHGDTETEENKKKNLIIDLKRRDSSCYEKFSNILRNLGQSDILDQYIKCYENEAYPIVSDTPGTCLIINNKKFYHCDEREGSEKDVELFSAMFESLNYQVICQQDVSRLQLIDLLAKQSQDESLKKYDIFVTIIMSHGISDHVITSDNELVSYDEILDFFSNEHCPYMVDKPKVFIFNCCRSLTGNQIDSPLKSSKPKTDQTFSDILMIFSTLNNYLSVRDEVTGTLFAKAFARAMEENPNEEICTIVTKANNILCDLIRKDPKNRVEPRQAVEQRKLGPKKNFYFSKLAH